VTKVLVVDDEPQLLRAMRITLQVRGYDVRTAATGRKALSEAAASHPDIVVLDLGLPDPAEDGTTTVDIGGYRVDLAGKRAYPRPAAGEPEPPTDRDLRLTPTEWRLLEALVRHPGKLVSQRHLITEVWGPAYTDDTSSLRLYVNRLRRKLEPEPSRPRHLLTEPGMGYRFQP
jgi:two-component system KDP operon response regulator KdpE